VASSVVRRSATTDRASWVASEGVMDPEATDRVRRLKFWPGTPDHSPVGRRAALVSLGALVILAGCGTSIPAKAVIHKVHATTSTTTSVPPTTTIATTTTTTTDPPPPTTTTTSLVSCGGGVFVTPGRACPTSPPATLPTTTTVPCPVGSVTTTIGFADDTVSGELHNGRNDAIFNVVIDYAVTYFNGNTDDSGEQPVTGVVQPNASQAWTGSVVPYTTKSVTVLQVNYKDAGC
jgi:hypothetical protein